MWPVKGTLVSIIRVSSLLEEKRERLRRRTEEEEDGRDWIRRRTTAAMVDVESLDGEVAARGGREEWIKSNEFRLKSKEFLEIKP